MGRLATCKGYRMPADVIAPLPLQPLSFFFVGLLKRSRLILRHKVFVCSTNANDIRNGKRAMVAKLFFSFSFFKKKIISPEVSGAKQTWAEISKTEIEK